MGTPNSNSRSQNQDHTQTQVTEPPASGSAAAQPEDRAPVAAASATVGHTPGPWVWHCEPGHGGALCSAHGTVIDHTNYEGMWFGRYLDAEDAANARLIAAAPDLLEAARLARWNFKLKNDSGDFLGDDEHEAWTALDAAILKAEGRQ